MDTTSFNQTKWEQYDPDTFLAEWRSMYVQKFVWRNISNRYLDLYLMWDWFPDSLWWHWRQTDGYCCILHGAGFRPFYNIIRWSKYATNTYCLSNKLFVLYYSGRTYLEKKDDALWVLVVVDLGYTWSRMSIIVSVLFLVNRYFALSAMLFYFPYDVGTLSTYPSGYLYLYVSTFKQTPRIYNEINISIP